MDSRPHNGVSTHGPLPLETPEANSLTFMEEATLALRISPAPARQMFSVTTLLASSLLATGGALVVERACGEGAERWVIPQRCRVRGLIGERAVLTGTGGPTQSLALNPD